MAFQLVDGGFNIRFGRDVAGQADAVDVAGQALGVSGLQVEDADFSAGLGQTPADRRPNPLTAARHQRDPAIETKECHGSSSANSSSRQTSLVADQLFFRTEN